MGALDRREAPWARRRRLGLSDDDVRLALALMLDYGLSSREVAEKFNVDPSTVRQWLRRTRLRAERGSRDRV